MGEFGARVESLVVREGVGGAGLLRNGGGKERRYSHGEDQHNFELACHCNN